MVGWSMSHNCCITDRTPAQWIQVLQHHLKSARDHHPRPPNKRAVAAQPCDDDHNIHLECRNDQLFTQLYQSRLTVTLPLPSPLACTRTDACLCASLPFACCMSFNGSLSASTRSDITFILGHSWQYRRVLSNAVDTSNAERIRVLLWRVWNFVSQTTPECVDRVGSCVGVLATS
jgi:hypothetical protein